MPSLLQQPLRTPRPLSPARAAALARLLAELDAWCSPRPLADPTADDLRAFVAAKLGAGYHASTLRRQLKMLRAHYRRLYVAGGATAATYVGVRSVELPPDTTLSGPAVHARADRRTVEAPG
jgi:site-specific recombinase XerC